jgi:outer membrane protein
MNKLFASLFGSLALLGLAASPVLAQPAPKIVVVDMAKLLDEHYETAEQNTKLKTEETRANEELERLNKEGQTMVSELKEMEEKAKNPTLSTEAKEKLQAEMRTKVEEIQRKQNEVNSFRSNTQRSLQQRIQNFRKVLFDKIDDTVAEIAKEQGATLVLDKSGLTHIGLNTIVYADPSYDITAAVQAQLDKGRPAGTPAAPASTDEGKVTFPGAN